MRTAPSLYHNHEQILRGSPKETLEESRTAKDANEGDCQRQSAPVPNFRKGMRRKNK